MFECLLGAPLHCFVLKSLLKLNGSFKRRLGALIMGYFTVKRPNICTELIESILYTIIY
jgi:hypothetical protein